MHETCIMDARSSLGASFSMRRSRFAAMILDALVAPQGLTFDASFISRALNFDTTVAPRCLTFDASVAPQGLIARPQKTPLLKGKLGGRNAEWNQKIVEINESQ